ncbi:DNA cytosine methyltransferase [Pseudomonas sp. PCH446]
MHSISRASGRRRARGGVSDGLLRQRQHLRRRDPAATITTRDRLALVTVTIKGHPYVIVDIGMRMLTPAELYHIQGFPRDYKIDFGHDGRKFSNKAKVRMCGNSVSPKPYRALLEVNPLFPEAEMQEAA